jgi:hypothetical protein
VHAHTAPGEEPVPLIGLEANPESGVLQLRTYREHVRPVDDLPLLYPCHAEHKSCQTTLGVISTRREPLETLAHLEDGCRHTLGEAHAPALFFKADALLELRRGGEQTDREVGTQKVLLGRLIAEPKLAALRGFRPACPGITTSLPSPE